MKLGWTHMTQSQKQNKETEEKVYQWINILQKDPDNEEIKEAFVKHYEGLVHSLARKYSYNRGNHEDLAQIGMIGLLISVERFDPEFGKTFEAFAIPTIIGEIKRFIRDKTWSVHVPRRIKELGPKINKAVDELTDELQRSPSMKEIADYIEISEEEVIETMEMSRSYKALSVDYKHEVDSDGGSVSILELISSNEDDYRKMDVHMLLETALPVLPEREQQILK